VFDVPCRCRYQSDPCRQAAFAQVAFAASVPMPQVAGPEEEDGGTSHTRTKRANEAGRYLAKQIAAWHAQPMHGTAAPAVQTMVSLMYCRCTASTTAHGHSLSHRMMMYIAPALRKSRIRMRGCRSIFLLRRQHRRPMCAACGCGVRGGEPVREPVGNALFDPNGQRVRGRRRSAIAPTRAVLSDM